jgi:hypothetical protein
MIPKIIHYCWLSDDPIPSRYQEFIDEWHTIMPDYFIKKWDRNAIDLNKHPFAKDAFEAKKYAFAADYIRIYALYTEGGIYLDSDVQVFQSFDKFLGFSYFTSYENHWDRWSHRLLVGRYIDKEGNRYPHVNMVLDVGIQAAIIGSEPLHPFISSLWGFYKQQNWKNSYGDFSDLSQNLAPMIHARLCEPFGFKYLDKLQLLGNNMVIFPSDVFRTENIKQTLNTHAIHVSAASWKNKEKNKLYAFLKKSKIIMAIYVRLKLLFRVTK